MFHDAARSPTGWHTILQAAPTRPSTSAISDHASIAALKPNLFPRKINDVRCYWSVGKWPILAIF